jgi:hypothetical protein
MGVCRGGGGVTGRGACAEERQPGEKAKATQHQGMTAASHEDPDAVSHEHTQEHRDHVEAAEAGGRGMEAAATAAGFQGRMP